MRQRARKRKPKATAWTGKGKELQNVAKFDTDVVGGPHIRILAWARALCLIST